jgi:iron complex outermembrane recepter protein
MKIRALMLGGVSLGFAFVSPCQAQSTPDAALADQTADEQADPESGGLADIVVTAQRTSQSLQKVPIAITAVTADDLAGRQITGSLDLETAVPNLSLATNGTSVTPFLRGVGSNQSNPNDEASVATYIDGVYIPSVTGNIFKFNNVERIEVLKGPQGTLFGRNATGGVVQIITRDPTIEPTLDLSIGVGMYETVEVAAYVAGGIAGNLSADIALSLNRNGEGIGRDINLGTDIFMTDQKAVRSKILWTPGSSTEIRLTGDYSRQVSTIPEYQLVQGVIGADGVTGYPGERLTNTDFANGASNEIYGASLRIDQDLGFARFVSISGYRHVVGKFQLDQDATPTPIVRATINQFAENFSQEFQLLAPKSSAIDWLLGAYYFDAKYAYTPLSIGGFAAAPFASIDLFGSQRTKSYSGYGQATVAVLENTKLTLGLRYTSEDQTTTGRTEAGGVVLVPDIPQAQSFRKLTWRAAIDQQFSDRILGYLSYNRGIKSGGFNMINAGTPGYRPEVLDAYELGFKTQFADNAVRFNIAAFIYDYKDIQVFNITGGGAVLTTNAAAARIHGVDADLTIKASPQFTISAGAGYLDGEYTDFPNATFTPSSPLLGGQTTVDATGNDVIYAPKISGNVSADYRLPTAIGEFSLSGTAQYRDKVFVSAVNNLAIPAYTVVNATLGWTSPDDSLGIRVWARNLLDEDYYANRTEQALGFIQYLAPPRTVGVTLTYKSR